MLERLTYGTRDFVVSWLWILGMVGIAVAIGIVLSLPILILR